MLKINGIRQPIDDMTNPPLFLTGSGEQAPVLGWNSFFYHNVQKEKQIKEKGDHTSVITSFVSGS